MAQPPDLDSQGEKAAQIIVAATHPVALVGAGMSVESGIPPFRGPQGLWTKYGEPDMLNYQRFLKEPKGWWEARLEEKGYMAEFRKTLFQAKPNPGHYALAELESMRVLKYIITQNVDNLHRKAGSQRVAEIHGNSSRLRCISCSARWDLEGFRLDDLPPRCPHCGGVIKSDTVMFGEPIPSDVMRICQQESDACDCMVLVGTSATVYPAASFPTEVKSNGGYLIEINSSETEISHLCDVVLRAPSGQALPPLVAKIRELKQP
ncbi:MAG: NAD-dependent deacylase [Dehalococcoidia bacterium]